MKRIPSRTHQILIFVPSFTPKAPIAVRDAIYFRSAFIAILHVKFEYKIIVISVNLKPSWVIECEKEEMEVIINRSDYFDIALRANRIRIKMEKKQTTALEYS